MAKCDWAEDFGAAITVCDDKGVVVEINKRSRDSFASEARELMGSNILDCHPEPARSKLVELLQTQSTNVYTIEKKGRHKLIYQAPWYKDGQFAGLVELSLPIPNEMPHFDRNKK